ncbi:hypothetical protein [Streptomyces sp. V1I1]|nr:hypothetical protein [Streptomyces sp. V1I1]MDQ0938348.1 hypothetical protein [Streptomyces sp. V1I1]
MRQPLRGGDQVGEWRWIRLPRRDYNSVGLRGRAGVNKRAAVAELGR